MLKSRYKKASSKIAKRRQARQTFGLILKIGLPVSVLVGLVFLLRADFLQVKNFEVVGTETISAETLKNTALSRTSGNKLLFVPKSNLFLLNKNNLADVLLADFTRIEKIEVNKQFFSRQVELKITERKADFLWCSAQTECFNMTKEGLVFASSAEALAKEEADIDNKIIFRGILNGNPLMKNFATPAKIQNYLKLVEVFKNGGFEISSINIESSDRAVAKTKIGDTTSDIIFNPEETDLSLVAQNTILLINETKTKNPSAHFNYIDARFGNKMFYKLK